MKYLPFLAVALLGQAALADELVLKDGTRIQWVSLKLKGDAYDVETRDGKHVTVRKADVDRLVVVNAPEIAPLTGATFTTKEKRKTVSFDLLPTIDAKRDIVSGPWKVSKSGLSVTHEGPGNAKFQFKHQEIDEYDFSITVERKHGPGDFVIGLVSPKSGKQFVVVLDGTTGRSGILTEDGWKDEISTTAGSVLTAGNPRKITVMVRQNGVLLKVDDKDLAVWAGDWSKLPVPEVHAVPSKVSIFLVCCNGGYEVSRALVIAAKSAQ